MALKRASMLWMLSHNKIAAAAVHRSFALFVVESNLLLWGCKVKMPVCTSPLSQLLHDEQYKHVMEVALRNIRTGLEHYNKTLPELQA